MSRIRTIKPGFFKNAELYDAEAGTGLPLRVAYAGLWTVADREGRFKWKPREIKTDVLPYDNCDMAEVLNALASRNFIFKYKCAGEDYGYIPKFKEHQHVNPRESLSTIPSPDDADQDLHVQKKKRDATRTRQHPARGEGKEFREGEELGTGREGVSSAEPQAAHALDVAPVICLPTNREGEEVPIFQTEIDDYTETYPGVDVPQEFREMRRWLMDNRRKRKTASGMMAFVNTWLSKQQDKGSDGQKRNGGGGSGGQGKGIRGAAERTLEALERAKGIDPGLGEEPPVTGGFSSAKTILSPEIAARYTATNSEPIGKSGFGAGIAGYDRAGADGPQPDFHQIPIGPIGSSTALCVREALPREQVFPGPQRNSRFG